MLKGFTHLRCGLIGEHLSHSFSPQIHRLLCDYPYTLTELSPDEVGAYMRSGSFDAINVTIPYKKTVIPFLDTVSSEAMAIGAVNTVVRDADGRLHGYNTDYFGFHHLLTVFGIPVKKRKVLVLGSGGASVTVCAVLRDLGADVVVISRSGKDNYSNLERHADAELIVNTTPVGMYPHNGASPLSLDLFPRLCGVADIIYNPARTQLLLDAEARGIPTINGLPMLTAQAAQAAMHFTGQAVSAEQIEAVTAAVAGEMQNMVLVGMPGCGKSTVGRLLAEQTGKRFFDADAVFTEIWGRTPAEVIAVEGEDTFRRMEHDVLCGLGKESAAVIATGGGAVTRESNYAPLHQNAVIVFMERDVASLSTDGRPLSARVGVEQLYRERIDAYRRFSDLTVRVLDTPAQTANAVLCAVSALSST